ncbi:MAG: FAD-dependent monooxygenase, partial [Arenimonas sp.]
MRLRPEPVVNPDLNLDFDILILGGGLVGCSLACALEGRGLRVGLVEAGMPTAPPPGFDERRLALAAASMNALGALGVLRELPAPPSPLRRIHVSRVGDFGSVRLDAAQSGRESFGGVVSARELGLALERRLGALVDTRVLRPLSVTAIANDGARCMVSASQGESLTVMTALLVVAADGTRSFARAALGIGSEEFDYGQTVFVCGLSADRAADGTAYERFSEQGPLALLPMGRDYGAICAVANAEAARVRDLDDFAFRDYFQQRFGWRAGRFERVGLRSAHPLRRVLAQRLDAPRALL